MTIYSIYPYTASEKFFKELEENGVIHYIEKKQINLDYADLPKRYGRESIKHRALKKVAFQMLQEIGESNPRYEFNYHDVYSQKLRIVIECGDVTVSQILGAIFHWATADEVWVLGYPNEDSVSELIKFKYLMKLAHERYEKYPVR